MTQHSCFRGIDQEWFEMRLGDGQSVNIWSQPWIQNNPNYYITIAPPLGLEQLTVGALINHENSNWRWEMLNQFFNDHNVKAIQSIPLLNGSNKDQQFQKFSNNGDYTLKSKLITFS